MQKLMLKIPDMQCSACVMRLESLEDDLPGVASAKASYHKQTLEIAFDEKALTPERILSAVKALGYTPVSA